MKHRLFTFIFAALSSCGLLTAGTMTLQDLPEGDNDTISISLSPANGALTGAPGQTVGWGFTVNWASNEGDDLVFYSSSVGSTDQGETNPNLLANYADLIGAQGGPTDGFLSPSQSPWTETFNANTQQGVGSYQISSDPTVAIAGAQDTGQLVFDFQVYNGDPSNGGVLIGDSSYSYSGASVQFSVTVQPLLVPEPAAASLVGIGLAGLGLAGAWLTRARRRKPDAL